MSSSVVPERPALRVDALAKEFGATRAVDHVSFDVQPGTIHALLGGNGSGKSTTVKLLAGVHGADAGTIAVAGRTYDARSFTPADAKAAGLRFVHQQQSTFDQLTVAENLAVGHGFETAPGWRVRWRAQRAHAREVLSRFHIDVEPERPLAECGIATQTMIAIARALQGVRDDECLVLVLDEPTAALPPAEVNVLLDALRRYAGWGQTIVYVTHRLEEVVEVAHRATVLRDGRVVATLDQGGLDHDSLVGAILGRSTQAAMTRQQRAAADGDVRLACSGLAGGPLRAADVSVRAGEVVGVAGLLGSGRSTLLRLVAGDADRSAGSVRLDGESVAFGGTRQAALAGVAYAPEDRLAAAAFPDMTVRENLGMTTARSYFRGGRFHHRDERRDARQLMQRYSVKAESTEALLSSMSGGNQQKVLLARWLRLAPRLLLLDEPTQGVDVGARAEIWSLIHEATREGAAVLAVLSDFEELVTVCDRAVVVRNGRTVAELDCDGLTADALEGIVLSADGGIS